jgi:hypothetical protein
VRERKFLRSAVSDTAGDLGGLSRGTVAEYLRGECLRIFVESGFDIGASIRKISLSAEVAVNDRVKKRLMEYLENIAEAVDTKQPWDVASRVLRPKAKNLPQKYHPFLDQIGQAFHGGKWTLERK